MPPRPVYKEAPPWMSALPTGSHRPPTGELEVDAHKEEGICITRLRREKSSSADLKTSRELDFHFGGQVFAHIIRGLIFPCSD